MIVRLTALALLFIAAVSAADARPVQTSPELSYVLRLRGNYAKSAICHAEAQNVRAARRMTGLHLHLGGDWSPDGRQLAFAVWQALNGGIRIVGADGGAARVLTRPRRDEMDSSPSWSPDGTRIAFARYTGSGRSGIWTVRIATGEELHVSNRFAGAIDWSPTGDLIAADVGGEFNTQIDLVRPTGGIERTIRVGNETSYEDGVSWSPEGTRLAVGGGLIVDANGNGVGRYAPAPPSDVVVRLPAWSPDGTSVAYSRALSWQDARTNVRVLGDSDLYLGSPAGGAPVRLTTTAGTSEEVPAWRPTSAIAAGRAQPCVLRGTAGRNVIRGTPLDDLIDAGGGNDLVHARGGGDFVAGGRGSDVIEGGAGQDELWGEEGNDTFRARDRARDRLRGGFGVDSAFVDRRLDYVTGIERLRR